MTLFVSMAVVIIIPFYSYCFMAYKDKSVDCKYLVVLVIYKRYTVVVKKGNYRRIIYSVAV